MFLLMMLILPVFHKAGKKKFIISIYAYLHKFG